MGQEDVKAYPKPAKIFFKANTELVENVRYSAQFKSIPPMIIDDRPELEGENSGPNSVELLLVALGTCQEIMYSAYASAMGINLDSVKVDLKGNFDLKSIRGPNEKIPAGFTKISFKTNIESNADEEMLMSLIDAIEEHCPVMNTISTNSIIITIKINLAEGLFMELVHQYHQPMLMKVASVAGENYIEEECENISYII
jgi:putative redox protein